MINIANYIGWQTFTKFIYVCKNGQSKNAFNQKPQGGPAAETTTDSANGTTTVEVTSKC